MSQSDESWSYQGAIAAENGVSWAEWARTVLDNEVRSKKMTNKDLKVGDRVKIDWNVCKWCPGLANPECAGTVIKLDADNWVEVDWDNGVSNVYRPNDSDLVAIDQCQKCNGAGFYQYEAMGEIVTDDCPDCDAAALAQIKIIELEIAQLTEKLEKLKLTLSTENQG